MRPLTIASFAVALALTGCAGPSRGDHYRVAIDPTFSADQQQHILSALADWSDNVPVTFDPFIGQATAKDGVIYLHPAPGDGTWAVTYGNDSFDGGDIHLDVTQLLGGAFRAASEHELGHAMGLVHETDSEEPVLMYPSSTEGRWADHATVNDVAQWFRVRGRVAP